jgi:hypothetical protein
MSSGHDDRSVLGKVTPAEWNPADEAAREAALEEVSQVIGLLSSHIAREEHAHQPDPARIDELKERQAQWAQAAESLYAASRERIDDIRAACSQILRGAI